MQGDGLLFGRLRYFVEWRPDYIERRGGAMTLNIMLVAKWDVFQCADFRLTFQRGHYDDYDAQKQVLIVPLTSKMDHEASMDARYQLASS